MTMTVIGGFGFVALIGLLFTDNERLHDRRIQAGFHEQAGKRLRLEEIAGFFEQCLDDELRPGVTPAACTGLYHGPLQQ